MDQSTITETGKMIMVDWDTFFWVLGIIVLAFSGMITALSFFFKGTINDIKEEQKEMRFYMKSLQDQVRVNSEETKLAVQAIKINQENETKRIDTMQETYAEKIAASIVETLKYLQGNEPVKVESGSRHHRGKRH